jgi:hypothetical protein
LESFSEEATCTLEFHGRLEDHFVQKFISKVFQLKITQLILDYSLAEVGFMQTLDISQPKWLTQAMIRIPKEEHMEIFLKIWEK